MANYTGAVKFPDGLIMFFSYQGTSDVARRRLFDSVDAVEHQQTEISIPSLITDDEAIEVMPYFMHSDTEVMFMSRASKTLKAITGGISAYEN